MCFRQLICGAGLCAALSGLSAAAAAEDVQGDGDESIQATVSVERPGFDREGSVSIVAGVGMEAAFPMFRVQVEPRLANRSGLSFGLGGLGVGVVGVGEVDISYRQYVVGNFDRGMYVDGGAKAGGLVFLTGGTGLVGPTIGLGGKLQARNGLTFDFGLSMGFALRGHRDGGIAVTPVPAARLTLGRTLRKNAVSGAKHRAE